MGNHFRTKSSISISSKQAICPRNGMVSLCIDMMRIRNLSRMICRLHISSKVSAALIFSVEYSLEFPFSSAILLRGPGYSYYRSSEVDIREDRAGHASYNVAKKVVGFEFEERIPRTRLCSANGDGFKGAPLRCTPQSQDALPRDSNIGDENSISPQPHATGGPHHV
jgi:hypothetical protein